MDEPVVDGAVAAPVEVICPCCGGPHAYCGVRPAGEAAGSASAAPGGTAALPIYTNDQIAAQINRGNVGAQVHFNVTSGGTLTYSVSALNTVDKGLAREALAVWSDITGIRFAEVSSGGNIRFNEGGTGASTSTTVTGSVITAATVSITTQWIANYGATIGSYGFQTYLHEIGHALGLTHAGNYNVYANYATDALFQNDSWATTVMSYFSETQNGYLAAQGYSYQYLSTPTVADALAVTALYGTPIATRTGDTVYGVGNTSGRPEYDIANAGTGFTIFDGGGNDTLDYSTVQANQRIDLHAESVSSVAGHVGNMSIARGVVIENAIGGAGDDTLIANAAVNHLTGGAGADTFVWADWADSPASASDTITDFATGIDHIDLRALAPLWIEIAEHADGASIRSVIHAHGAGGELLEVTADGAVAMADILGGASGGGTVMNYDGQDQLSGVIGYDAVGMVSYRNVYSHGMLTMQVGYDTTAAAAPLTTGDAAADQDAAPASGHVIWRNSFDGEGRLILQEGFNGSGTRTAAIAHDMSGAVTSSHYDDDGRLTDISHADADGSLIDRIGYDAAGHTGYSLIRGAGGYVMTGAAGAQVLEGGPGPTTYLFDRPDASTASAYDVLAAFRSGADHVDLSQVAFGAVTVEDHHNGWTSIFFDNADAELGDIAVHGTVTAGDLVLAPAAHLTMM